MRVGGIKVYGGQQPLQNVKNVVARTVSAAENTAKTQSAEVPSRVPAASLTPQSVISPVERRFFSRMFPEAGLSGQLAFNRQAQLQFATPFRGNMFDSKI